MICKIKLDPGARAGEYAHETDAGIDLFSRETATIYPGDSYLFDTGFHILIPEGFCGTIIGKSGLNCNIGITSQGLIDAGYTGSIKVKLYNHGHEAYTINKGDKISQLVIQKYEHAKFVLVDDFGDTVRGENGLGSTGR